MRYSEIINEDEASDKAARLEATMAFSQIKHFISQNKDNLEDYMHPSQFHGGSYGIEFTAMGLEYPKLWLLLAPRKTDHVARAAFGYLGKGNKLIMLAVLLEPSSLKYIETRITGMEKDFVHEFQHYLMSLRAPRLKSSISKYDGGDHAGYFNDNDETNAYYQEGVHDFGSLISALAKHLDSDIARQRLEKYSKASVQELIKVIKQTSFGDEFLDNLNERNTRALNKRLARFIEQSARPMMLKILAR
jgi:hypothetical protein